MYSNYSYSYLLGYIIQWVGINFSNLKWLAYNLLWLKFIEINDFSRTYGMVCVGNYGISVVCYYTVYMYYHWL